MKVIFTIPDTIYNKYKTDFEELIGLNHVNFFQISEKVSINYEKDESFQSKKANEFINGYIRKGMESELPHELISEDEEIIEDIITKIEEEHGNFLPAKHGYYPFLEHVYPIKFIDEDDREKIKLFAHIKFGVELPEDINEDGDYLFDFNGYEYDHESLWTADGNLLSVNGKKVKNKL